MAETSYPGLDYSLGQSNFNRDTGIHFGVISQHSLHPDIWDTLEPDYGTPHCPDCGSEISEIPSHTESFNPPGQWVRTIVDMPEAYEEYEGSGDYACESCEHLWDSSEVYSDEPLGYSYEGDGYKITDCLDSDLMILESPYYTFAQFCSPCVPGAGNLESPCTSGPKCYALGSDWFEDSKLPYRLWSVASGKPVIPAPQYRITGTASKQNSPCNFPDSEIRHSTRESAEAAIARYGLQNSEIWVEYQDSEVSEAEAEAYWQSRESEVSE